MLAVLCPFRRPGSSAGHPVVAAGADDRRRACGGGRRGVPRRQGCRGHHRAPPRVLHPVLSPVAQLPPGGGRCPRTVLSRDLCRTRPGRSDGREGVGDECDGASVSLGLCAEYPSRPRPAVKSPNPPLRGAGSHRPRRTSFGPPNGSAASSANQAALVSLPFGPVMDPGDRTRPRIALRSWRGRFADPRAGRNVETHARNLRLKRCADASCLRS